MSMAVPLQRQPLAGKDADVFDLEAVAGIDGLVIAPGPVHFSVKRSLFSPIIFQMIDDGFYILRLLL